MDVDERVTKDPYVRTLVENLHKLKELSEEIVNAHQAMSDFDLAQLSLDLRARLRQLTMEYPL